MSVAICPNGHTSNDPEWCDTCGARIGGSADPQPAPAAPTTGQPSAPPPTAPSALAPCPNCGAPNDAANLFCEQCGYDFTTGQAPPHSGTEAPPAEAPLDSHVNWVVVVEVDPRWYELKGSLADQPCPPGSSSTVPLTQHTALVGRSSQSRDIHPEIALDGDTGVSRRHAQLVRDGDDVVVIDLSSTNGTYVVAAGAEPDDASAPIEAGVPTALHDGDRVYVGAWTRLTFRVA